MRTEPLLMWGLVIAGAFILFYLAMLCFVLFVIVRDFLRNK